MCNLPGPIAFLNVSINGATASLNWAASEHAHKYYVYYSYDGDSWVPFPRAVNTTEFVVGKLLRGKPHLFKVTGSNHCGVGPDSPVVHRKVGTNTSIRGIELNVPPKAEPYHYALPNSAQNQSYAASCPIKQIKVAADTTQFYVNIVCNGIVVISQSDVTTFDDGTTLTVTVPQNSIIVGTTGTHLDAAEFVTTNNMPIQSENQAKPKVFVETGTGRSWQLDNSGIDGFSSVGFNVMNIGDPLAVETLRSLGFIDTSDNLSIKFTHIVCGTGYAYVNLSLSPKDNQFTDLPSQVDVEFDGMDNVVNWVNVPTSGFRTLYRKINDGDWVEIGVFPRTISSYRDFGAVSNSVYCYKIGQSDTSKGCVFTKTI